MPSRRAPFWILAVVLFAVVSSTAFVVRQAKHDLQVTGRKYAYVVAGTQGSEIRVRKDDLVTVTFSTEDIPHSFTISDDHYRIDRRAERGKPVTFRFRADKAGEFDIRCTLTIDERCLRDMKGKLIVAAPGGGH
jgi:heme/copper-type cytochrome/quinol oxidase subunit 2